MEAGLLIEQRFFVETECDGWRLDRFLCKKIKRLSRNRIQRVIRGECFVDDRVVKPSTRVHCGQEVMFRWPAPTEPEVPRDIGLVYTDPWMYVIDKPSGLPVHPTARYHRSTLTDVLREKFPGESLQMAHRLDRETSGLMVIARSVEAGSALKQAFAKRKVQKRYVAMVHGVVVPDQVCIEAPLGLVPGQVRIRMGVLKVEEGGVPARTDVRVMERAANHTLVECFPLTGRQHQIRVHLASLGHPIVGDKLYPDETRFLRWIERNPEDPPEEIELDRHALHAAGLRFFHPFSGQALVLDSPLPSDLQAFWDGLSLQPRSC